MYFVPQNDNIINQDPNIPSGGPNFDDEPPLLEELGINFSHIRQKTISVLTPFRKLDPSIINDNDLVGPLVFGFLLGFTLLLTGKLHFGYIYGVGVTGSLSMYILMNLMSENGINLYNTVSVLGYCLLPMDILSLLSLVLNTTIIYYITPLFIIWSTYSASLMFVAAAQMVDQRLLIAYPLGLFYACFALLTIF